MFLDKFANLSTAYASQYDFRLILLSLIVSSLAIYIAFRVSGHIHRVRKISPWVARFWWLGGALIMGAGFWSIYFIGLLAFSLPENTSINLQRAILYLLPTILGSGLLLHFKASNRLTLPWQWGTAIVLGLGVGLMQYAGMTALHTNADMKFDVARGALTLMAAVGFSWLALKVLWRYEEGSRKALPMKDLAASSLVLGIASLVVHHVAMLSIYFFPVQGDAVTKYWSPTDATLVAWEVAGVVLIFSVLVYLTVRFGQRMALTWMVERGIDSALNSLDDSNEGVITTDSWGTITSFNRSAEELFGCPAARMIGENCLSLLPDNIQDNYKALLNDSGPGLGDLINRTHDLVFSKVDGTKFTADLVITPVSRRHRLDFVGLIRDNSAIKQVEADKEKFQKKLEFLLSASPVTIYTRAVGHDLPFTYVSPNSDKLLGYDAEQLLAGSARWEDLVHPEDIQIYGLDRRALRAGIEESVEYRLALPDGDYRWISDTRQVIFDDEGKPSILIGSWRDVHDQKLSGLSLQLNEERLKLSLKYANMATWDWIIETGEVVWSENMQQKLGLQQDKTATFKTFMEIVHPEDQVSVKSAFKHSLVSGTPFDLEYRVVWPDQSIHWLHSAGGLISDHAGSPTHMVGVLYEVTEKKGLHLLAIDRSATLKESAVS
jgi:PAS domain S-box-containing protein